MRRHHGLALLAFCALLAATASGADLATLVPEDAVLYAEVTDPAGIWADFEQSGLRDIVRAAGPAEMQFRLVSVIVQQVALQQFGVQWSDFVGKYMSRFALVATDSGGPGRAPVLLLDASQSRADLEKLLKETVETTLKAKQPAVTFGDERYQDLPLRIVNGPSGTAAYGFLGDAMAIGEPAGVKKLIDARARRPLASNEAFAAVRAGLAVPRGLVAYLNVARILADHRGILDGNPELARRLDDAGLSHAQWLAFSSAFDGRGVRDRLHLYTGDKKIGLVRLLGSLSPGTSAAATVLPKECPLVAALTFKDGPELWRAIVKFIEEGGDAEGLARLDEGKRNVLLQFGINLDEDLVAALGGEVFLAANPDFAAEFAAKRRMPTNKDFAFLLGLRVAKPEALKTIIHRVIASQPVVGQGVERKVEPYQGVEINTLVLPGAEVRPAYAFVGDYLLIARSDAVLRRCIDAHATGQSLAAAPRYRAVAEKMTGKHNAFLFVDIESLLVAAIAGGQAPPEGQPASLPVQLAGQLRGVCASLVGEKDGVRVEAYSRPGFAALVAAAIGIVQRGAVAPPPAGPREPKPADF